MKTTLKSIATGVAQEYTIKNKVFISAYKKDTYIKTCEVDLLGLKGDFQEDKRFHGGVDKAIHIGSSKHFELFKKHHTKDLNPLAIGCNIFIDHYDENDICIGDIYTLGDIKIQVTQPRQPCWKIGALFGKDVSRYISKNQATGWYVKVLTKGILDIKNPMILEKRLSKISIKELSDYLQTPPTDTKLIKEILEMDFLAQAYKDDLEEIIVKS